MIEQLPSDQPTEVSPPGATLAELIEERGIAQAELARRMGRPPNAISEIVQGTKEITEDTALELERVLGAPAHFWLVREAKYREFLARQRDAERAVSRVEWLDTLPIRQLQDIGALPAGRLTASFKAQLVEPALRFFGVASPQGWNDQYGRLQAAFHRAGPARASSDAAITAWLRLGEIEASGLQLPAYDASTLEANIPAMRALNARPGADIGAGLKKLCAQAGVTLLFVRPMAGTRISAVARWLGDRPLIQLSARRGVNDALFFDLFHAVAHILKHRKRDVFLHGGTPASGGQTREAQEADRFAARALQAPIGTSHAAH